MTMTRVIILIMISNSIDNIYLILIVVIAIPRSNGNRYKNNINNNYNIYNNMKYHNCFDNSSSKYDDGDEDGGDSDD